VSAIERAAKAAIDRFGTGANGVRLLAGTLQIHHELEAKIAEIQETEAAGVCIFTDKSLALMARDLSFFGCKRTRASIRLLELTEPLYVV
jgi:hypothetical protein